MFTLKNSEVAFARGGRAGGNSLRPDDPGHLLLVYQPLVHLRSAGAGLDGKDPRLLGTPYQMEGEPLGEGAFAFRFQVWDPELPRSLQDESIQETALLAAVD